MFLRGSFVYEGFFLGLGVCVRVRDKVGVAIDGLEVKELRKGGVKRRRGEGG